MIGVNRDIVLSQSQRLFGINQTIVPITMDCVVQAKSHCKRSDYRELTYNSNKIVVLQLRAIYFKRL